MATEDLPTVQAIQASLAKDDSSVMMQLKLGDGTQPRFGFSADDFTTFLTTMIGIGNEAAQRSATPPATQRPMNVEPIPITEMGIGPNQHDPTEAILTVRAGAFQMAFAVSLAVLRDTLRQLEGAVREGPPPRSQ